MIFQYREQQSDFKNSFALIAKYASEAEMPVAIAFRSPGTKGTNDTIKKATKKGFKVFVIDYDNGESKEK